MNQNLLLKISFIISVIGVLFLLLLSSFEPKLIKISEINETLINKQVRLQAKIMNSEKLSAGFFLLTIKDNTGQIQVTSNQNFQLNLTIEIIGKITEYKNQLQIQADKIQEIKK